MREAKKRQLREAYHGPLTCEQVARRHALGKSTVFSFWSAERSAGRLPAERPHFPKAAPAIEIEDFDGPITDAEINQDVSEAELERLRDAHSCNTSLAAMRRHHGDLDTARAQTAPLSWLVWDAHRSITPSHDMLMRMCRDLDARKQPVPA